MKKESDIPLEYIIQFDHDERWNNIQDDIDADDLKLADELNVKLIGSSEIRKAVSSPVRNHSRRPHATHTARFSHSIVATR